MAPHPGTAVADHVPLTLFNDRTREQTSIDVTAGVAMLLAYAHAWAQAENRRDPCTLTFSSVLAGMVACEHPLSEWLRRHLALRGSNAEEVTKRRTFGPLSVPAGPMTTTHSFRRALEQALALARGRALDVKHLMAAYPVVKAYHAGDFMRLRIDRRAWCLALADHLQRTEPEDEKTEWQAYERLAPEVLLPRYRPDLPTGTDLLGVGREVEAFAMLIASESTAMPLSVGVFGPWGAGKSYFMARLEERVARLSSTGRLGGRYLGRVAQVRFNAWHYSEGDVVASLVDQIFRNLRFGGQESDVVLAGRRADVLAAVAAADAEMQALRADADAATTLESRLHEEWQHLSADQANRTEQLAQELTAAQEAVGAAERQIAEALAAQAVAIDAARRAAPAGAALQVVTDTVLADPQVATLKAEVDRLARDARWLGGNYIAVLWGITAIVLAGLAAAVAERLGTSTFFTTVTAALAGAAPLVAGAVSVLRALAAKGSEFQQAILRRADSAVAQVEAQGRQTLQALESALTSSRDKAAGLRAQLAALDATVTQGHAALADAERRRQALTERLAAAARAATAARRKLETLTPGSLLADTIAEAGATDVFRQRLGTLSFARSYFQRLSEAMRDAREHAATTGVQPPLERIVLYIDDLDRCPEDKVREVLQAVHLLLAFDLFACVVAVDPRWVIQCLERSPGVRLESTRTDADLEVLGGFATPSDYLEKIFQVPLWLRPVPPERRAALAATLLERDLESPAERRQASAEAPLRPAVTPFTEAEGGTSRPDSEGSDQAATGTPKEVRIASRELDFLQTRLMPLLDGNARALKRFVNTYHLVKASLSEVEFDAFDRAESSSRSEQEPYRVCMAQLALLATQRRRARMLARLVDGAPASSTLVGWLDELAAGDPDRQSIARDLRAVLLPELEEASFDRFAFWFERTRRYSFYL